MSAIIVKDLVKRYGRFTAVQDVSFEVASGQVTALLGPNGAGKTTTIEILEGFLAPTAGTVQVLGVNPRTGGPALAGPDRAGPADHQPGRPAHGRRGADDVRGTVPEAAPDRGGPRPHRPGLGRQDQDRGAERGPASPGRPGPGHHRPAGDAVPGRADHRPGPGSTRGCGRSSRTSPRPGPPCCSPPTTWTRRSTWPTELSCWPTGEWSRTRPRTSCGPWAGSP